MSPDAVKILAEYGLPSLLLGLVSYAFFVFLKKHDAQAAQQVRECHNIVKAKDKEIARLHEARLAEQKEAIERVAKILKISNPTVRWRLHKARKAFRKVWEAMEEKK